MKVKAWDEQTKYMTTEKESEGDLISSNEDIFSSFEKGELSLVIYNSETDEERPLKVLSYMPEEYVDTKGNRYCQDDLVEIRMHSSSKNIIVCRLYYHKNNDFFFLDGYEDSFQDLPHDFFSEYAYKVRGTIIGNIYQNPEVDYYGKGEQ